MIESNFNKDLERKVDLYVNGMLDEQGIDDLWAELIQDEYYLDYTKSVANLKAVIEKERSAKGDAPTRRLRKYANYGIAAAIALFIGVVGVMNYTSTNVANDGLEPLSWIEYDNYRSANETAATTDNEVIRKAIQLANEGNTEEAITILEESLSSANLADEVAELSLTLGSIQYNYGDFEKALVNFQTVIAQEDADPLVLEKGYWFLGNTHLQLDNLEDAQVAFESTLDLDGQYSRVAERYLRVLNE
ncbi:MAG: hypothetical protein MI700_07630 [Balneolales bacterium]|nr:hypothetical protein [Balneolales bacterium]